MYKKSSYDNMLVAGMHVAYKYGPIVASQPLSAIGRSDDGMMSSIA